MKVIDASALAKYLNREKGWQQVQEYLLEGCITIELVFKEVANTLWKRVMRKELTIHQAMEVMEAILDGKIVKISPQEPLLKEAMEFSLRSGILIYDALYIILAKRLNTPLITSDRIQAQKAEEVGVKPILL